MARTRNGSGPAAVDEGRDCRHPSHRVIRLFLAYSEANGVRLRLAESPDGVAVSRLRHQPDGCWAFTMCKRCLASAEDGARPLV